ncbi:MAG: hypothetical protein ACT4O9_14075 [Blastocatellia bacterium]
MSRKNLVDGSVAYRERKFAIAEEKFRTAAGRDTEGATVEGRTAQLFLARTLHSRFIGDRINKTFAEEAVKEYRKAMPQLTREYGEAKTAYAANTAGASEQKRYIGALSNLNSTANAIPSLLDSLQQEQQSRDWQTEVVNNAQMPETARVRALVSLGIKFNSCANDITDTEQTKKTVKKDGKDAFQFVKPEKPEDLAKLKECVAEGQKIFEQTSGLETQVVKTANTVDVKTLSEDQLKIFEEEVAPFDSARSYRASMGVQASRLAEMEGSPDYANIKAEADRRRAQADELKKVTQAIKAEKDARVAIALEAANTDKANANANAPANK